MPLTAGAPARTSGKNARFPFGFRTAGEIAEPILQRVCDRHTLDLIRIARDWNRLVGGYASSFSQPGRIVKREGKAILEVRVDGARATEFTHRAPKVLTRIQTALGDGVVDDIRITQIGYAARAGASPPERALALAARSAGPAPAEDASVRRAARQLSTVRNPRLRDALTQLLIAHQHRD